MPGVRIAVVDDHPMFRRGVISILKKVEGLEIVGEGSSADDAVRMAEDNSPNVMLLDVSIPGGGINALRRIKQLDTRGTPTIVVMLTVSDSGEDVISAFRTGASGYLLKGIQKSELISAILSALEGNTAIDPSLAVRIIRQLCNVQSDMQASVALEQLTARETQVLDCVSHGMSNREIAKSLKLTPRTVKNDMTSIMAKLRVRNRLEAALSLLQTRP